MLGLGAPFPCELCVGCSTRVLCAGIICHAPVALLSTTLVQPKPWVYEGYHMTCYSNAEEKLNEMLWRSSLQFKVCPTSYFFQLVCWWMLSNRVFVQANIDIRFEFPTHQAVVVRTVWLTI